MSAQTLTLAVKTLMASLYRKTPQLQNVNYIWVNHCLKALSDNTIVIITFIIEVLPPYQAHDKPIEYTCDAHEYKRLYKT